jgi:hypothetical protein
MSWSSPDNVVVLEEGVSLPEGVHVTVTVEQEEQPDPSEVTDGAFAQRRVLGERMQAFGQRLGGRSVYDSWYLSLSETTGCPFWTAETKLYNAVHAHLAFVRWLGDYGEEADAPGP